LSLLRGIWLCAEAIPLEINNAAAANSGYDGAGCIDH